MAGCDIPVEDKKNSTIFQLPFPIPADDGKIKTCEFLNACKGLVTLLEKFGKVFIGVRNDMNGNILKLNNKFMMDKDSYIYIDDMILSEKDTDMIIATDALLWLNRGLHFVQRFFELFVECAEDGNDDLGPIMKNAYKETLNPYHGWLAQQLFCLILMVCPSRSQLVKNLSPDSDYSIEEAVILTNMTDYTAKLKLNVSVIKEFYKKHDLESRIKA